jgi:hypothetical protein
VALHDGDVQRVARRQPTDTEHHRLGALDDREVDREDIVDDPEQRVKRRLDGLAPVDGDVAVLGEMSASWPPVGASWGVPVFVGEFGASHDDPTTLPFMTAHFDALDALGLGGTEWEYSVSAEEWNDETASLVAADGTEFPVAAAVLRPFARAIAGDTFTTSFDASTGTFSLAFEPTVSAYTEVSLPARAYPGGFDVELTGGCVDTSHEGELLVRADPGASVVGLVVTRK